MRRKRALSTNGNALAELDQPVVLAAIVGAHGIAGEVRLKLFTDDLASYTMLDAGGRPLTLKKVRPGPNGAVARFAEITDRNAAEALRGVTLSVTRAALPPLAEGEFYHADLIGLPVVSFEGDALGVVIAIENFGAGDIVELRKPDGKTAMIPFRDGIAELREGAIHADPAFLA
jgi:16S rRNA processing protein RimM